MSASDEREAYGASEPGWPGFVAITVADNTRYTASTLAEWVRNGYMVSRVSRDAAVAGFEAYADEQRRRALGTTMAARDVKLPLAEIAQDAPDSSTLVAGATSRTDARSSEPSSPSESERNTA